MTVRAREDLEHWLGSILALIGFVSMLSLPLWADHLVVLIVRNMH